MGFNPRALDEQPSLEPHLELIWQAYHRLSRSRAWSEAGPQAITIAEVFAYLDGLRIMDQALREKLLDAIQEMDQTFLTDAAEKAQAVTSTKSDVAVP